MNKLKLNKESLKNLSTPEASEIGGGRDWYRTWDCKNKTVNQYTCKSPEESHAFICHTMLPGCKIEL